MDPLCQSHLQLNLTRNAPKTPWPSSNSLPVQKIVSVLFCFLNFRKCQTSEWSGEKTAARRMAPARPRSLEKSPSQCTDSVVLLSSFYLPLRACFSTHVSPHALHWFDFPALLYCSAWLNQNDRVSEPGENLSPSLFSSLGKFALTVTNSQWHLSLCCVLAQILVILTPMSIHKWFFDPS